jgi:small GTP-binding protein
MRDPSDVDDEDGFFRRVGEVYEEKQPDFSKSLTIAIIGKVSAGKSSLTNALLRRTRSTPVAEVGARSGVTKTLKVLRLDDRVIIVDSPGLDDIAAENSDATRAFLNRIDVGVLVVTGSADAGQRKHLDQLRLRCEHVFVVLNKVDEWDDLAQEALEGVINQWKEGLSVDRIWPVCTKGFDPESRPNAPMDLRGVDDLREALEAFLREHGKELLLARHMGDKRSYAIGIITSALIAVAAEAFVPGSAVYITATQAVAISSLHYLYTGRVLSRSAALATLPPFAAEAAGSTVFLWLKSLLPPTGVVDVVAAGVAVTVTLAILGAVTAILSTGAELHEDAVLRDKFRTIRRRAKEALTGSSRGEWASREFWRRVVSDLLFT